MEFLSNTTHQPGDIPVSELSATGTRDATTFLRGDNTWATPAGGGTPDKDEQYYKQVGTTPLERWYVAGLVNATALTAAAFSVDNMRATPFFSTRGGTLDRIAINVTTAVTGALASMLVYEATSDTNLYPSNLILDAGEHLASTAGVKASTINLTLQSNKLYWFVHWAGVAAATIRATPLGAAHPIFGIDSALGTSPGVGFILARAYSRLSIPNPFPSGASVFISTAPSIAARFSA